jgi:hypothetical protein
MAGTLKYIILVDPNTININNFRILSRDPPSFHRSVHPFLFSGFWTSFDISLRTRGVSRYRNGASLRWMLQELTFVDNVPLITVFDLAAVKIHLNLPRGPGSSALAHRAGLSLPTRGVAFLCRGWEVTVPPSGISYRPTPPESRNMVPRGGPTYPPHALGIKYSNMVISFILSEGGTKGWDKTAQIVIIEL